MLWKIQQDGHKHKNNKITPKNVSQKGLQSLTDVLQHPVCACAISALSCDTVIFTLPACDGGVQRCSDAAVLS